MVKEIKVNLIAKDLKIAIVVSRFNEFITNKLLEGAVDAFLRHDGVDKNVDVVWVPGSFELPLAAKCLVENKKYDAIVCLGTLIRGDTPHFDLIANEAAKGIASVGLASRKPVIFGLITADNLEQAIERAGSKGGNKGRDAVLSAIEMANLLKKLK